MARSISASLKTHFAGDILTLATCWKITRRDATVMGFTDHVDDLTFDSQLYKAATGFEPTDVQQRDDMSVDNMDVAGILDSTAITEADINAGIYDYAEIEIFMVNYNDLTQGRMVLKRGWIGEVTVKRSQFVAEIRGLAQKLQQNIGRLFGPSCDAILGDSRCGVNLASFTVSTTVSTVTDNQTFTASALTQESGWFSGGEIEWTSGSNDGLKMEVKEFVDGQVTLALPMPYSIQAGDGFDIIAGCDKSKDTCRDKFNNLLNFRGFPDLPGQDKLFETSGTFSGDGN